ncbi:MAG: hypothetical protein J3K34DRAFT_198352 [Monoraphidium minutum]|nr:MAG: hypothetical protein J3K34DRAFT_198352 [Monoraphidium minutum]
MAVCPAPACLLLVAPHIKIVLVLLSITRASELSSDLDPPCGRRCAPILAFAPSLAAPSPFGPVWPTKQPPLACTWHQPCARVHAAAPPAAGTDSARLPRGVWRALAGLHAAIPIHAVQGLPAEGCARVSVISLARAFSTMHFRGQGGTASM